MRCVAILFLISATIVVAAYPAFAATHTFSVSGKIVDGLWQPVEGANVTLLNTNGRAFAETQTGADGSYDLKNLSADTDAFTVQVSYRHGNNTYLAPAGDTRWFQAQKESTIDPGLTRLSGYYPYHNGYIRGQVVRFDVPSEKVSATVSVGSIVRMDTADGSFVFVVPPGTYDVQATHDTPHGRYVSETMKVTVIETDSIPEAAPITLELKREGITIADPAALLLSLITGLACLGGACLVLRKL